MKSTTKAITLIGLKQISSPKQLCKPRIRPSRGLATPLARKDIAVRSPLIDADSPVGHPKALPLKNGVIGGKSPHRVPQ